MKYQYLSCACLLAGAFAHYGKDNCQPDEISYEPNIVEGICAPTCSWQKPCPTDVPAGTTARPECTLRQDQPGWTGCGLVCSAGADGCPKGASCKYDELSESKICMYPVKTLKDKVVDAAEDASELEIDEAVAALRAMRRTKAASATSPQPLPPVQFVHKHTFATSDPIAASKFAVAHLGAVGVGYENHSCPGKANPFITSQSLNGSDFALHFVYNPLKRPGNSSLNASGLADAVAAMRGSNWATSGTPGNYSRGHFDQFIDNHVGLVVPSLDPYVKNWLAGGVQFICRTWCCGPGMPQFPDKCPAYSFNRTGGCEVGCYVEVPYGIILEFQCGIGEDYNASLNCLTEVQPEVFDLCRDDSGSPPAPGHGHGEPKALVI